MSPVSALETRVDRLARVDQARRYLAAHILVGAFEPGPNLQALLRIVDEYEAAAKAITEAPKRGPGRPRTTPLIRRPS